MLSIHIYPIFSGHCLHKKKSFKNKTTYTTVCISLCTLIKSLCFQFQHQKGFGQISEQIYNGLFNSLKEIHYLHLKSKLVKLHCTCMYAGARRQFCFGIQNFYQRMKNFSMKTFIWNSDWLLIK